MNTEVMPLFWRIAEHEKNGLEAVSLLMPAPVSGEEPAEFPTDVFFCSSREQKPPVDLRWSDEDSDLFMSLLDRVVDVEENNEVTLDINDGIVQGIVQLVALARFKKPASTDDLVGEDFNTEREETEIGDLVALNTRYGYILAIVVGLDSIDTTCVLLESVEDESGLTLAAENTLVVANRLSILSSRFADSDIGQGEVRH
ncbi:MULTISPECIES: hypothetical protein [unclassified Oceanobacter]|nr:MULTISPECIES: hypothetical protein [unclassified Oceanobacter]MDO6682246.1 hypothetical protein [Oceanobacter sp. 5_MG-2023]MDP2506321.1 hypothetical protein [Oceanobacter sp. 3_MG-2023]MDP2546418.1 hypothetical protein [Oceanobacter sp. 4_MG-2023]MDP2609981.1 hypothetical protein [Oceanobacter sp. 1_MG-2023]MDP2613251.1 hypothetical protein [Oceanobacter sp. 2_MG-2023]